MFKNKDLLLCFPCFISRFYILFPNPHFDPSILKQELKNKGAMFPFHIFLVISRGYMSYPVFD